MREGESAELRLIRQTHGIVEGLEKTVTALDHAWRGNGGAGLAEKVRTLEAKVKALEQGRSDGGMKFWIRVTGLFTAIALIMEVASNLLGGG